MVKFFEKVDGKKRITFSNIDNELNNLVAMYNLILCTIDSDEINGSARCVLSICIDILHANFKGIERALNE